MRVWGGYLSINGYSKNTTPYLNSIKNDFLNLGLASSGANCSSPSNLILMSGTQLNQFPDKNNTSLKTPNIFQYAKKAGYKTHYISGQSSNKKLQNYMTKYDLKYIDHFYQPPSSWVRFQKGPEQNLIQETIQALDNKGRNFIFMVKLGSHFAWESSYPQNKKVFNPTLKIAESMVPERREEALNSYANSIRYGVDDFFKAFFEQSKLLNKNETLIIYTSDHGQSVLEEGSASTHCDSTNPKLSQGVVPLLIFNGKGFFSKDSFSKNQYSHFQIFPTTLKLMGYEKWNGKTFFDGVDEKQEFVSGDLFGRSIIHKTSIKSLIKLESILSL